MICRWIRDGDTRRFDWRAEGRKAPDFYATNDEKFVVLHKFCWLGPYAEGVT